MDWTILFKGLFLIKLLSWTIQAYQWNCPQFSQWKARGEGLCNNSEKYSCLLNTNDNEYMENCAFDFNFLGPGYRFVISGLLDGEQCGLERFQPFSLLSNTSSRCVLLKSECNGEGQIVYSNGTKTHDRSCRCNYVDNFVFVTKPKATCYCIPSEEDCSCYYKRCDVDQYLSPEYQCVHFNNWTGLFQCPEIKRERIQKHIVPPKSILKTKSIQDMTSLSESRRGLAVIAFVMMCCVLVGLSTIFYENDTNLHDNATNRLKLQDDIAETENSLENMKRQLLITKEFILRKPEEHKTESTLTETRPFKLLKKIMVENDYLVVIGVSGSGKSVILYQLAVEMYNKEGYQIIISNEPSEILEKNNEYRKQLFVFDDVCGKFTFDSSLADSWNLLSARILNILKGNKTKMLFSCRSNISKEQKFQAVSILSENTCDIQMSDYCMTTDDNYEIANIYLHKNDVGKLKTIEDFNTSKCVPLLYNLYALVKTEKTDILEFFSNTKKALWNEIDFIAKNQTCSTIFFFFVMYNNALSENFVKDKQLIMSKIGNRKLTPKEVINVIQNCVFVKKQNATFLMCHDMIFDILVTFVSQCRLDELLEFACADILCERCHFESIGPGPDYGCIKIPVDKENLYFKRLIKDSIKLKKCFSSKNRQLKFTSYRKKFIKCLIDNLNVIQTIYKSDVSLLLISTFQGLSDVVRVFLSICDTGIINMTDEVGRTALYIAAEFNDINTGTILLKGTCNLSLSRNDECHVNESPLHIAAFKRNYEFIELLIKSHIKLDQINAEGMTALHISCTKEDEKLVKLLLDNGANPNISNTKNNLPLHTAADIGNSIIVGFLIIHKSNLQMRNKDGESPLYVAASKGHSDVVELLLQADPKVVSVNDTSMSPLCLAAKEGFDEIVKLLLEYGADPNSCALLNLSPLFVASENGHFDIVEYLLTTKADPNVCTYDGFTPLYVTSLNKYTNIVHVLLKYRADPNISSSKNLSPLFEACQKGYSDIVELLLENGADVGFSDRNKRSPLYVASREGHIDIVKLLLDKGANPNQATVVKRTPLFAATLEGHPEVVQYLLDKDADLNISTVDNLTPLSVAIREEQTDIVEILKSYPKNISYSSPECEM